MTGVIYHPRVPDEVRDILAYYEDVSASLADAFWDELIRSIGKTREHPEINHYDANGRRRCNLRRFPYHFLYRTMPDGIRITAVRHNRRDPRYGARRQ